MYYVAKAIAKVFREMVLWSLEIKSTSVDDEYDLVKEILSEFPAVTLQRLWDYPDQVFSDIEDGIKRYKQDSSQSITVRGVLTMEIDEALVKRFNTEMNKIKRR